MATAATAKYEIRLENKTKRAFKAIGRSLKKVSKAVFSLKTGFVSAAGIAGLGYLIKRSMDATDEMAKMSRAVGVSVEQLQGLRHAANLGGLQATQLDKAVQKLAINMADMSRGVGLAKDVFEKHNISVNNADGSLRTVMEVMADVADVTAGMSNATEKADLAYKLFGARGAKMINMLNGGSKAMHAAMKEAEKFGLVMSAKTAQGVEDANDSITRLTGFLTSSFTRTVAELAPLIEKITEGIQGWVEMKVKEHGGIGEIAKNMANSIVLATITILHTLERLGNGFIEFARKINDLFGFFPAIQDLKEDLIVLKSERDALLSGDAMDANTWMGKLKTSFRNLKAFFDGEIDLDIFNALQLDIIETEQQLARLKKHGDIELVRFNFDSAIFGLQELLVLMKDTGGAVSTTTKNIEDQGDAIEEMTPLWKGAKEGYEEYEKSVLSGTKIIAKITTKLMKSTEDVIYNMVMGIKTDFKALTQAIIADLTRMAIRKAIVTPLFGMLGFANGGRPPVGRPSIVGERGAEVFVPDSAGTIIPNNQLGGTNNTKAEINFNVQAIDANSFNHYLVNNRDTIESIINNSLLSNGSVRRTINQVA